MPRKARTTFYSLALTCGIVNTGLGIGIALWTSFSPVLSPVQWIFGMLLAAFSLPSWIWISILLSYNNRPTSTHALTRASVHFYTFAAMVPIFLAIGIMIFTQLPRECDLVTFTDGEAGVWCGIAIPGGLTSIFHCTFAALAALDIHRSTSRSSSGLNCNVTFGDKKDVA